MSKLLIDDKHNPKTAIFWARFATDAHKQGQHCPTIALYENEGGCFFVVEHPPSSARQEGLPTHWEQVDPREWLKENIKWLDGYLGAKP